MISKNQGILGDRPTEITEPILKYELYDGNVYLTKYQKNPVDSSKLDFVERTFYSSKNDFAVRFNYSNDIGYDVPLFISLDFTHQIFGIKKNPSELLGYTFYQHIQDYIIENFGRANEFYKSVLFSIFVTPILLEIGNLTDILKDKYNLVLGGGLILRYYYSKYYTKDIDLKLYPINKEEYVIADSINQVKEHFENICTRLNQNIDQIKTKHKQFIEHLKSKNYLTNPELIQKYSDIFEHFSDESKFKFVQSLDNPNIYKLIFYYNNDFPIAMLDFNFYNSDDTLNNHILTELEKPTNHLPLTSNVEYSLEVPMLDYCSQFNFNIPQLEYLKKEKEILYNDIIGDNVYNSGLTQAKLTYLTNKFQKHFNIVTNPELVYDFTYLKKYQKYKHKYLKLKNKLNSNID